MKAINKNQAINAAKGKLADTLKLKISDIKASNFCFRERSDGVTDVCMALQVNKKTIIYRSFAKKGYYFGRGKDRFYNNTSIGSLELQELDIINYFTKRA